VEHVLETLDKFSRDPEGVQILVDANFLDTGSKLLESTNKKVRSHTCKIIGSIATNDALVELVLKATPCTQLVSMLL
jgi:hypothetical protein